MAAVVVRVGDGSVTRLLPDVDFPQYVDHGVLVFGRADGTINAVGFDAAALKLTGEPELVTDRVLVAGPTISKFSVSWPWMRASAR